MKRPDPKFPIDETVSRRLAALERLIDSEYGGSPSVFEERTGIKMAQVSQWFTGYRALRDKALRRLEDKTGKQRDFFDHATHTLAAESGQFSKPARSDQIGAPDLVIPQYAAGGAMGNGGLVLEEKQPGIIKSWHVDQEWLRLNVKSHTGAKNLCIVTGFGPSMRPLYNPGDPLLLDAGVKEVDSEGVFFFRVGDHGYIKQLQRIPVGRETVIRAKSLNPTYDPFNITPDMDFEVFGKVLTVWKSEQV